MPQQTSKEQFRLELDDEDRKANRQLHKMDKEKFAQAIKKSMREPSNSQPPRSTTPR